MAQCGIVHTELWTGRDMDGDARVVGRRCSDKK